MTFEATDTRAPAAAAEEAGEPARPRRHVSLCGGKDLDTMMDCATEGEAVASQLRGLAALFRGVFLDDVVRRSDDAGAAADIIDDVMRSIAARLDANAERARATRDHLARGGAR